MEQIRNYVGSRTASLQAFFQPPATPTHPSIYRVAIKIIGEAGFLWIYMNWANLNAAGNSLTKRLVVNFLFTGSFFCKSIDPVKEKIQAFAHDLSHSGEMKEVARQVVRVTSLFAAINLGAGFYILAKVAKKFTAVPNLENFPLNIMTLCIAVTLLYKGMLDLKAAFYRSSDLEGKRTAECLTKEFAPSSLEDTSGTTPPEQPLRGWQKTSLYAVQFFSLVAKAAVLGIFLRFAPRSMLLGTITGYCSTDFLDSLARYFEMGDSFEQGLQFAEQFLQTASQDPTDPENAAKIKNSIEQWKMCKPFISSPKRAEDLFSPFSPLPKSIPSLQKQASLFYSLSQFLYYGRPDRGSFGPAFVGFLAGQSIRFYTSGKTSLTSTPAAV